MPFDFLILDRIAKLEQTKEITLDDAEPENQRDLSLLKRVLSQPTFLPRDTLGRSSGSSTTSTGPPLTSTGLDLGSPTTRIRPSQGSSTTTTEPPSLGSPLTNTGPDLGSLTTNTGSGLGPPYTKTGPSMGYITLSAVPSIVSPTKSIGSILVSLLEETVPSQVSHTTKTIGSTLVSLIEETVPSQVTLREKRAALTTSLNIAQSSPILSSMLKSPTRSHNNQFQPPTLASSSSTSSHAQLSSNNQREYYLFENLSPSDNDISIISVLQGEVLPSQQPSPSRRVPLASIYPEHGNSLSLASQGGSRQVSGTSQIPGTNQIPGSSQTPRTNQILGTNQTPGTSQVSGTNQIHRTNEIPGTNQNPGTSLSVACLIPVSPIVSRTNFTVLQPGLSECEEASLISLDPSYSSMQQSFQDDEEEVTCISVVQKTHQSGKVKYSSLFHKHIAAILKCQFCKSSFEFFVEWVFHFSFAKNCLKAIK